jgi:hypothetical protein
VNVCEYPTFTVAEAIELVVIEREGAATVSDNVFDAVLPAESETLILTLNVPFTVGVPEILPSLALKPDGSPETLQVNEPVPPEAERVKLYDVPAVADPRELVEIVIAGATTLKLKLFDADVPKLSVTVT